MSFRVVDSPELRETGSGSPDGRAGELSHDVRVLACGYCGAPNHVPVQGGFVQCAYCRAGLEIALRREESLARGEECEYDRIVRLRTLRAQDGKYLQVPPSVERHLLRGSLDPKQWEVAFVAWRDNLRELQSALSREAEETLFFLTCALTDHLWVRKSHVEARALLECAAEVLRTRRFRQSIYCVLARRAAQLGDLQAAEDWLRPCDPLPYDLHMDSDYRLARAFIATLQGDFRTVLQHLGETSGEHPFVESLEALVVLYRAHAIEHVEGVLEASKAILAHCETHDVELLRDIRDRAPIELCAVSFSRAMQDLPLFRSALGCGPVGCGVLLLAAVIPMWLNVFWWKEIWFESATATWGVPLVLSLFVTPFLLMWWKEQKGVRDRRRMSKHAWKGSTV